MRKQAETQNQTGVPALPEPRPYQTRELVAKEGGCPPYAHILVDAQVKVTSTAHQGPLDHPNWGYLQPGQCLPIYKIGGGVEVLERIALDLLAVPFDQGCVSVKAKAASREACRWERGKMLKTVKGGHPPLPGFNLDHPGGHYALRSHAEIPGLLDLDLEEFPDPELQNLAGVNEMVIRKEVQYVNALRRLVAFDPKRVNAKGNPMPCRNRDVIRATGLPLKFCLMKDWDSKKGQPEARWYDPHAKRALEIDWDMYIPISLLRGDSLVEEWDEWAYVDALSTYLENNADKGSYAYLVYGLPSAGSELPTEWHEKPVLDGPLWEVPWLAEDYTGIKYDAHNISPETGYGILRHFEGGKTP